MKRLLGRQQKGQLKPLGMSEDSLNTGSNSTLNKISGDSLAINLRRLVGLQRTQSEKQGKCEYCTELDVKKRTALVSNIRSNLTRTQTLDTPASYSSLARRFSTRTVSVVSKMSQQHIVDANLIYLSPGTPPSDDEPVQISNEAKGTDTPPMEADPVYTAYKEKNKNTGAASVKGEVDEESADEKEGLGFISLSNMPRLYRADNYQRNKDVIDG